MKQKLVAIFIIMVVILGGIINVPKVLAVANNDPALESITTSVGNLNPIFDYLTIYYTLVVPDSIKSIDIEAIPKDKNATVVINGNKNLKTGLNKIEIVVTAENKKTTRTYTINVTKGNVEKTNVELTTLQVEDFELIPAFSKEVTEYIVKIPNDRARVDVTATPESSKAKVEVIGNEQLENVADKLVKVVVTAEDEITKKEYNIIVSKQNAEEQDTTGKEETFIKDWQEGQEQEDHSKENEVSQMDFIFAFYVMAAIAFIVILVVALRIIQLNNEKKKEGEKKKERKDDTKKS